MFKKCVFVAVGLFGLIVIFKTVIELALFLSGQQRKSNAIYNDGTFAVFVDIGLLMLFALQHSGMASHWWKRKVEDSGLEVIQRSLYVIATASVIQVIFRYWQPACCYLWDVDTSHQPLLWLLFASIHFLAWLVLYGTALLMDFSEMVGLKQVYYYCLDEDPPLTYKSAKMRRLFHHMRHGGTTSLLVILWIHPLMSLSRLVLACLCTFYVLRVFSADRHDYDYVKDMYDRKLQELNSK